MSVAAVRTPADYESHLRRYLFERSEEGRAVRVGEKEVSERAAIVERYSDLFTREQLDALRAAEEEARTADERERLYRLRKTCESGLITAALAEREDELENAVLAAREELGRRSTDRSAEFNGDRLDVLRIGEELEAEITGNPDPVARTEEEKGISLRELEAALA